MKHTVLILAAFLPILAFCDIFTERSFTVCGTNFVFEFEEDAISHTNKCRIADDIIRVRSCWSNSAIECSHAQNFSGRIVDENVADTPYLSENGDFPIFFNLHGTNRCLFITQKLSQAYTNAFAFVDANTNMYAAAIRFVDLMVSENYENLPSNEFYKVVYQTNRSPEHYATVYRKIISELKEQKFIYPSVLGLAPSEPGDWVARQSVVVMLLPAICWSDFSHSLIICNFYAIWHEGMWRLASPPM